MDASSHRRLEDFGLPPVWAHSLLGAIARRNVASGLRLVVLDDDPMAGQALYGVPVLTRWDEAGLAAELERSPVVCLLTDARSLDRPDALTQAAELGALLRRVETKTGRRISIASRGDSTLRGHFPLDMIALLDAMTDERFLHPGLKSGATESAEPRSSIVFAPYFGDGGRYTIGDTQYVLESHGALAPAGKTEFARDPVFAYEQSHIPSWLAEKTDGRIKARDVVSISIDEIRLGGPDTVAHRLLDVADGSVVLVNAADDRDLEVFVAGLIEAEAGGKRFVYQSAAPFMRVRAGLAPKALLGADELDLRNEAGGLVIVGSHVARTNEQLAQALRSPEVDGIELMVTDTAVGSGRSRTATTDGLRIPDDILDECARAVSASIIAGRTAILYTSRRELSASTETESLALGRSIGDALCAVVQRVETRPRYVVVKGGSTASALVTRALGVERATILGRLLPGVPVWRLDEGRFPGLVYVIFAGNVGDKDGLASAIERLNTGPSSHS